MTIDYEKAWERLKDEVAHLVARKVQQVSPEIIHVYMDFIEDIVQWESRSEEAKKQGFTPGHGMPTTWEEG